MNSRLAYVLWENNSLRDTLINDNKQKLKTELVVDCLDT